MNLILISPVQGAVQDDTDAILYIRVRHVSISILDQLFAEHPYPSADIRLL